MFILWLLVQIMHFIQNLVADILENITHLTDSLDFDASIMQINRFSAPA